MSNIINRLEFQFPSGILGLDALYQIAVQFALEVFQFPSGILGLDAFPSRSGSVSAFPVSIPLGNSGFRCVEYGDVKAIVGELFQFPSGILGLDARERDRTPSPRNTLFQFPSGILGLDAWVDRMMNQSNIKMFQFPSGILGLDARKQVKTMMEVKRVSIPLGNSGFRCKITLQFIFPPFRNRFNLKSARYNNETG